MRQDTERRLTRVLISLHCVFLCVVSFPRAAHAVTFEWELLSPTDPEGDGNPPALHFAGGAVDPVRNRFVVYGGRNNATGERVPGLWEFDGLSWKHYDQATAFEDTVSAWDPVRSNLLIAFGADTASPRDWVRTWDGTNLITTMPSDPEGDGNPGPVVGAGVVFDGNTGKFTAYGGKSSGVLRSSTWEWSGTSWDLIVPTDVEGDGNPGGRVYPMMVFDEATNRTYLFGGKEDFGGTGEDEGQIWEWDGVRWLKIEPNVDFSAIRRGALVYHPVLKKCVILGGDYADNTPLTSIYLWDGKGWEKAELVDMLGDGNHVPRNSPVAYMDSLHGIVAHSSGRDGGAVGKTWVLRIIGLEGEEVLEGELEGQREGQTEGEGGIGIVHTLDQDGSGSINISELLRGLQLYNANGYHCQNNTEDGYAPGAGDQACPPHNSDYDPQDWFISLSELLRMVQYFHCDRYRASATGEDGFELTYAAQ
ncbi:MAG: hypothetical protein GC168_17410 [Candidatus Hydrogenedens sp.]|nr:hypothetical protein [Candidatus Hydrogenedens sp.]